MNKPHVIDFTRPTTAEELAVCLGINVGLLGQMLSAGDQSSLYLEHRIPKKRTSGGASVRIVWEVHHYLLRDAHRAFARRFEAFARDRDPTFPNPCAYGYVRGRGTRDNAERHCGATLLLRADIEDFFASISSERLKSRFLELGLQTPAAEMLAKFATINGVLPLGLNASPMLANLVCSRLDEKFQELCARRDNTYTRYADDIAISGMHGLPTREEVAGVIEAEGFQLSRRKFRTTKNGQAHFVTGLSISDPTAPHVPRKLKRRLRQELYYCQKFGTHGHLAAIGEQYAQTGINRIDGTVRYVASIERRTADRLRRTWNTILYNESASTSYAPIASNPFRDLTFLFDESRIETADGPLLALACVTTDSPDELTRTANFLIRLYLVDPFSPGRKAKVEKVGLHFTDVHEDLRSKYVALLSHGPFRCYVAFAALPRPEDYRATYRRLLHSILPRRFQDADRSAISMVFEENSQLSREVLKATVKEVYDDLVAKNNRRPIHLPSVQVAGKDQANLSVPDFMLGVFSHYYSADPKRQEIARLQFERLRDKYRHIVNVETGQFYSRRHPLQVR